MRPILFILICLINTVLSYYSEKTRFDRSINDKLGEPLNDKQWTFTDDQTLFIAYKDRNENVCYLEKLKDDNNVKHDQNDVSIKRREKKYTTVLYVPNETLTKLEAWREAGGRIVDFCQGRNIYLLQKTKPIARNVLDPFLNEVPIDENDISSKRIADIVLTPLINRAKREIQLENRKRLNEDLEKIRSRRQTSQFRGRFRGQTQSQYLHLGNDGQTEGKAEAEATQQSSRAIVAGNNGMGQAQSMSSSGSGCEDCPGYQPDYAVHVDQIPGKLQVQGLPKDRQYGTRPGVGAPGKMIAGDYPGSMIPGTGQTGVIEQYPGAMVPGTTRPKSTVPEWQTYPGGIKPGTGTYPTGPVGPEPRIPPGQYPSDIVPGRTYPGAFVPGGVPTYPGGVIPETTGGGRPYPGSTVPGSGVMYPGGVEPGSGLRYPGDVAPETVPTGGDVAYPGSPIRGTTATGEAGVYRGGDVAYPGSPIRGTTATGEAGVYRGGDGAYPGSPVRGTTATGEAGVYPGSTVPVTGIMYPAGVSPGSGVKYPAGSVPETIPTRGDVIYPGSPVRGTTTTGEAGVYPGGDIAYPGSPVRGTTATGEARVYTGGAVPGTVPTGGGVPYPGGAVPGTVPTGGGVPYPGGVAPGTVPTGGGVAYPGGVAPGTVPIRDSVVYPAGPVRGPTVTGIYPESAVPGTVPIRGGIPYPGGTITGTTATGKTEIYIGSTAPERLPTGGVPTETLRRPGERYPAETPISGVSYPISTGRGTYPGVSPVDDRGMYPVDKTGGSAYPGRGITTDERGIPGARIFPSIVTDAKTDVGASISYPGIPGVSDTGMVTPQGRQTQPGINGFRTPGTVYPGAPLPGGGVYPDSGVYRPGGVVPGTGTGTTGGGQLIGQYPPSGRLPSDQIPGVPQYPTAQYPSGRYPEQYYPGGISGQTIPGQYPGGVGTTGALEPSQYYQKPKDISATSAEDDSADTQASSSVKQVDSGTETSASAQGKYGTGTAQSQVSGIYSGSASFSAQAGTSDINRSAHAEISGGKDGAVSNAEGVGGRGKSQAQVQLNSDSGATSTGAQSSGWNHGTNSQVQASSKGGMADAQANGEGSTSSQAQIGFHPYLKDENKVEKYSLPFRGGGTASAQSGTYRGQSQSQLQGSFQYGITYTGAAQAGSGSGAAASRKPFHFNLTNSEVYRPYKPSNTPSISKNDEAEVTTVPSEADFNRMQGQRQGLQTSSSSRQTVISGVSKEIVENAMNKKGKPTDNKHVVEPVYEEEEYDDQYEDEDYDSSARQHLQPNLEALPSNIKQDDQHQSQMIQIGNANRYDVRVTQDSNTPQKDDRLQPGESLPGYTVPPGFRGRVMSVAGDDTIAKGDGKAQSQTVALIPAQSNTATLENKSFGPETRSLHNNYARFTGTPISKSNSDRTRTRSSSNGFHTRDLDKSIRPSYYTVTNSVAGKIDDNKNSQKKYEHRYYTKSSTCGYFTFSCNIVYGSNGRTKICKPKVPTYPDGTPMKC